MTIPLQIGSSLEIWGGPVGSGAPRAQSPASEWLHRVRGYQHHHTYTWAVWQAGLLTEGWLRYEYDRQGHNIIHSVVPVALRVIGASLDSLVLRLTTAMAEDDLGCECGVNAVCEWGMGVSAV